jgi:hypothetical protein
MALPEAMQFSKALWRILAVAVQSNPRLGPVYLSNVDIADLYYSREADPTVIIPLNDIATEQTTATEQAKTAAGLLDYLAAHPDAKIRVHACDMILHIHSDTS